MSTTADPFLRAAFGMFLPKPKRKWGDAPGTVETYVIHHDDGTWERDPSRWTWYCTGGACGEADESDASNSAVDPLPNWAAAMEGLSAHFRKEHPLRFGYVPSDATTSERSGA